MRKLYTIICIWAVVMMTACTSSHDIDEVVGEADALCLETLAMLGNNETSAKVTRAHWNDDDKFSWDNSPNEMVVIVKESATGNIIPWGTNKSSSARVRNVSGLDDYVSVASITSNSGILKTDIQHLTVGESPVYFFSPVLPDANVSSVDANGMVTLALPYEFVHDETPSLSDFRNYTYIKGESTVSEISNAQIQVASTRFTGIPAVIRFAVTNDRGESIRVTRIKVSVDENVAGGFPKTLTWNPGISSEPGLTISTELHKTLLASMGTGHGHEVLDKESGAFYAFMFPSTFESATLTLEGTDSSDDTFTYSCDISSAKTFESGKIYTWNLTVENTFMSLGFNDHEDDIFQW